MANPAAVTKFPGRTILVVDDEEQVRTALASLLEREGYTVITTEGPTEGLEILRQQAIKLVISDHNMPGMNGVEFLKLVRERYPHVVRGGSWTDPAKKCRSAARFASNADFLKRDPQSPQSIWWMTDADFVGFRIVCGVDDPPALKNLKSKVTKESP